MNIKITHNWLLEYLDTDASPYEIQKYLSLCGPSIERIEKKGNDYVYDIEITSNKIDTASVFGIAQEACAILPQFGKKAKLKFNPLTKYTFKKIDNNQNKQNKKLTIQIKNNNLCSRFTAIVLSDISLKSSSELIKKRLELCDIKSINNIVDISNYLMISLGQPTHIFDYDKITNKEMIMRESKKQEKVITLDGNEIILPGGDIVIKDKSGKIIDLCGIMGGLNSSITSKTKNIVFFVQTYNKVKIRKTSMITGQRTIAATYFEKGLDEERVESTLAYGVELLKKYANAQISSKLYDIYPKKHSLKTVSISTKYIEKSIGVKIDKSKILSILSNLGFSVKTEKNSDTELLITIPSYRKYDVEIKQDIIEEVARIYGYHNIPSNLQPAAYVVQDKEMQAFFNIQNKTKYLLKHIGLHEVINYSMISKTQIENLGLKVDRHLKLSNSLSEDIEYLRITLIQSLITNIKQNEGKRDILRFFEIAKTYIKKKNDLPDEKYMLSIAVNTSFSDLKGILETLLYELNILNYKINPIVFDMFSKNISAQLLIKNDYVGYLGKLKSEYKDKNKVNSEIYIAELDFSSLVNSFNIISRFYPISPYAVIKLDLNVELSKNKTYAQIINKAYKSLNYIQNIKLIDLFKNKATLRFYFSSNKRNITEEEAKKQLKNLI